MNIEDEIRGTIKAKPKLYKECPYCGYKNKYGKYGGVSTHIAKVHPKEWKDHDKARQIVLLLEEKGFIKIIRGEWIYEKGGNK